MRKFVTFLLVVLASVLSVGCSAPQETGKDSDVVQESENVQDSGALQENNMPQETETGEGVEVSSEPSLFEGVVDTSSLYLIREYVRERDGWAVRAYITLPSCMEATEIIDEGIEQIEFGSYFRVKGRDDVLITIYTSSSSRLPRPSTSIGYQTAYGQKINYSPKEGEGVTGGWIGEDGMYNKRLAMLNIKGSFFYDIDIKCPPEWLEENQVMLDQFVKSLVVLDEENKVLGQWAE